MPLPSDLQSRLDDPAFWGAYFFEADDDADDSGEDDEPGPIIVEFEVGGGYALVLDIDGCFDMVDLGLRVPGESELLEIGWDDQAHWHPDSLRWAELDLIARAAAVLDPTLAHPGAVLALTGRFVVLDAHDDVEAIGPVMDAAFGPPAPGAAWWPTADRWLSKADGRRDGIVWQRDENGDWAVDQADSAATGRDLHSVRRPGSKFPFAAWRALLAAAESTVAQAGADR
ncbi:hypothetical protein [Actinoplanes sp. CA-252034]|uniref:hypothetical protein n=1 Tax=Actinoplanes sp. CA-252034 TaxID=3239906 RepID=UPI003D9905BA